jgi:hypothetical protein
MRRDLLLLAEMIDAAEQAQHLVDGVTVGELEADRQRRDALLWNFTVLGEASGQLSCPADSRLARTCRTTESAARRLSQPYPATPSHGTTVPDTEEVTGSNPVRPTRSQRFSPRNTGFAALRPVGPEARLADVCGQPLGSAVYCISNAMS